MPARKKKVSVSRSRRRVFPADMTIDDSVSRYIHQDLSDAAELIEAAACAAIYNQIAEFRGNDPRLILARVGRILKTATSCRRGMAKLSEMVEVLN